jgi:hypothetical protein
MLAGARTSKNDRHVLVGLLRQSVFGRLAGYEDVQHHFGCPRPTTPVAAGAFCQGRLKTQTMALAGPEI